MRSRSGLATIRPLVRDTFRQACASAICWMMLAVTGVCTLVCLSVRISGDVSLHDEEETVYFLPEASPHGVAALATADAKAAHRLETDPARARREGVEPLSGRMTVAFGAVSIPIGRERADAVRFLELVLGGGVAGTLGLLLALVWTSGFVPTFLEPGAAAVLLAKPVTRRQLLLGKYAGVLTFVASQVALFVALTWLALGARTGVWDVTYWWCLPLLLLQFATFYSLSLFLGVLTRSTVACVFGSVLFWLLAWGMNYGCALASGLAESPYVTSLTIALAGLGYWVFPKPIDGGLMLFNALDARHHFDKPEVFRLLESSEVYSAPLSIVSSLVITGLILAVSAHQFEGQDY
jgi:ABC-type transport system involved in multi-copper enzyme maturation permease subunit